MNKIMTFAIEDAVPDRAAVYENQGIPSGTVVPGEIEALYEQALALLRRTAGPAGIGADISRSDFAVVYDGQGQNDANTPVGDIFRRAEQLALFAVTLGERTAQEIDERFESNDFALGVMLDAMASAAADKLAELAEQRFRERLTDTGQAKSATRVLRYSPGYCGWHISGQRKLFEYLCPEKIGITLNDSCLMQPLKSVSGVIIAGPGEIHSFEDSYPCCSRCEDRGCRERIRAVLAQ